MKIIENPDLSRLCSIRIGGTGRVLYLPQSAEDLRELLPVFADENALVCGWGCNMVFPQKLQRPLIKLDARSYSGMELISGRDEKTYLLEVGAGAGLGEVLNYCRDRGYAGMEGLTGIPASIGGAVAMNAGAHGSSMSDVVESAQVFRFDTGQEEWLTREEMAFVYRGSIASRDGMIVTAVRLRLYRGETWRITSDMQDIIAKRVTAKIKYPSCGSVFKNPEDGRSAGQLLDWCALKGTICGGLRVSEHHANIMENFGDASFADFEELLERMQQAVRDQFGIDLQPEVKIIR